MAVPDWPTSFGYNMFALPVSQWFHGGVFDEHTHRLWASSVGVLVVILTRWLGGASSRRPLAMVGLVEVLSGLMLLTMGPAWKGVGHFLLGIGGVVLAVAAVGFQNPPASPLLSRLGWLAFWAVQIQGLLGGLRVVLDQWVVGSVTLGLVFGLLHGCLGQAFFVLLGVIALKLSPFWERISQRQASVAFGGVPRWIGAGVVLIALQLILGATMRHQHAGLAVSDFPTAYGRWWPALDPDSLARYNQSRPDDTQVTAFQIVIHLAHRLGALATVIVVALACRAAVRQVRWESPVTRGTVVWVGLIGIQCALGVSILWTNKAADVATAHVAIGAASLLTGTVLILVAGKLRVPRRAEVMSRSMAPWVRTAAR